MGSCFSLAEREESTPQLYFSPRDLTAGRSLTKRHDGSGSSLHSQLLRIPGRLLSNGASSSTSLFSQQGTKGINQDTMIVWESFGSRADAIFCGVFDGHGPYGHMVAKRVRDSLPLMLSSLWGLNASCDVISAEYSIGATGDLEGSLNLGPGPFDDLNDSNLLTMRDLFSEAFYAMDSELQCQNKFNCSSSGSTAVTLIKQGQDLVIANIGDSRAVLGTRDDDNSLVAVQLTVDLKPDLPEEEKRIKQCKGRVFALQEEPGKHRVWLPDDDSPGLAMARAFGDFCLKDFGLISVPDISYRHLTEKDEFIVLATDGVWDVLSNSEVVEIIATSPTRSSAAYCLVQSAVTAWTSKYPAANIDDCTVVCLYLNELSDSSTTSSAGGRSLFKFKDAKKASTAALRRSKTLGSSSNVILETGVLSGNKVSSPILNKWSFSGNLTPSTPIRRRR